MTNPYEVMGNYTINRALRSINRIRTEAGLRPLSKMPRGTNPVATALKARTATESYIYNSPVGTIETPDAVARFIRGFNAKRA